MWRSLPVTGAVVLWVVALSVFAWWPGVAGLLAAGGATSAAVAAGGQVGVAYRLGWRAAPRGPVRLAARDGRRIR